MAFALLANLPAVNGLYSSFFPLLTYFFLGGIHQMVPGKVSPPTGKHKDSGYGEGGSVSTFILLELIFLQPETGISPRSSKTLEKLWA